MELNISPDDINRFVSDAIIKSTLGDAIKAQVNKAIAELSSSWNNPIESVVKAEVARIVALTVCQDHGDAIKAAVAEKIAEKMSDDLIGKLVSRSWDDYFSASR